MSPLVVLEKGKRATGVVPRLSPSNTRDRPTASQTATNCAQAPRRVELPNADVGGTPAKISGVAGIVAPFLTAALLVQVAESPHVSTP